MSEYTLSNIVWVVYLCIISILTYLFINKITDVRQYKTFFLSGDYNQKSFLNDLIQKIEKSTELKCTWNWTKVGDHDTSRETLGYYTEKQINGVVDADVFIAIFNDECKEYRGTFIELGCALGLKKKIFIYNPFNIINGFYFNLNQNSLENNSFKAKTNCFYHPPEITQTNSFTDLLYYLGYMSKPGF